MIILKFLINYNESKLVEIKGNHPLRLSTVNLAIVKKYCEGKVETESGIHLVK